MSNNEERSCHPVHTWQLSISFGLLVFHGLRIFWRCAWLAGCCACCRLLPAARSCACCGLSSMSMVLRRWASVGKAPTTTQNPLCDEIREIWAAIPAVFFGI